MGKNIWGAVLVAAVLMTCGYPFCALAQQRLSSPGMSSEKPSASLQQRWQGKTITLFTDEEDVKAVFRVISKILNVPITFGEGITETVSVEFKNQPLREAFDFLLHQFDLDYTEEAQAIHVYKAGRGAPLDVLIPLDKLDIEEARTALQRFGLQKRDLKIIFDAPTHSVFVSGAARDVRNVQQVIRALEDSKRKTVSNRPEIRYYPLRYAKVSDIQLTIGKTTVTVPGLVRILPQLLKLTSAGETVTITELSEPRLMGSDERRRYNLALAEQIRAEQMRSQANAEASLEPLIRREASVSGVLVGAEPGTMTSDPRTNTIIIRDYPDKLDEYARIIRQLDQPVKMVKLDVLIIEAGKDFAREVGVGWSGYKRGGEEQRQYFPASSGTARDVFGEQYQGTPFTPLNLMPLPETVAGTPVSAYGLAGTFIYTGAQWTLFAVISAAETRGLSKTLNKSSVVTMDNMQAIVEAKRTVTYKLQTGGDNPTVESRDIDAGLTLTVTPHIVEGNDGKAMVEMVVKAERSSFLATRTDGIPEKATTNLTTQAVIGDQATLVVGGLFEERYQVGETGIPCLMNVPVAGYLFKTASARDPKTNILFFVSPTVIPLDSIPYEGQEMKDAVDRSERELKQIDPEQQERLIEKRLD